MPEKGHLGADGIMTVAELKPLLAKAKRGEPVHCAVALDRDKEAVLLLDRKKQPRQLSAELRKKAKEAGLELSAVRFGRAEVDGAEDARTVRFVVNKEAPGTLGTKLTALLRKAGYGRAEIVVDAALDSGDEGLEAAMAVVGKSGQVWEATLRSVERQVADLHERLSAAYDGHGFAAQLGQAFHAKVEPMLESLDASLVRKLAEIGASTDAAARSRAVAEAREGIARCEGYLAGEPLIAKLDANPLVPLAIGKTLTASLEALSRSLDGVAAKLNA